MQEAIGKRESNRERERDRYRVRETETEREREDNKNPEQRRVAQLVHNRCSSVFLNVFASITTKLIFKEYFK